jgi:hypothetical protein
MGLISWVLLSIGPTADSPRRVDRWANPHIGGRGARRRRMREPDSEQTAAPAQETRDRFPFERREAWNAGK